MAPEQLKGAPVDARTDLFSLGILLYELATGLRPFQGASSVEISSAILRDAPPPPTSVRGDMPRDLARILERCLEKDPDRRFQTAKDVRNELEFLRRSADPQAAPARPRRPEPVQPTADTPSIAVLPFVNRSASADDEYFSDGLADELISVLVKIKGLRVAARTSSAAFKGRNATIEEAGRALNVRSVLEGSVRKAGNRVRISVQLVRVEDGVPLWSETYDRTLDDIFAVQDDIAQAVVKELRTTLLGEAPDSDASGAAKAEVAAAAQGRGESAEAHRLYLEGRFYLDRFSQESTTRGVERLEAAVALDPSNALAWAELARGYTIVGGFGFVPVKQGYEKARAAVGRALALVPDLPEGLLVLGNIQGIHDFDFRSAEASFKKAYELAPENSQALDAYGQFLSRMGRFAEARPLLERALERDPLSARGWGALAALDRVMGRYPEAEVKLRKVLEIAPDRISTRHILAIVLRMQGRLDEALVEARKEPAEWGRLTGLSAVHYAAGRIAESDEALHRLIATSADDSAFQIGALYALRGDLDEAFRWLNHAADTRDAGIVLVRFEPSFESLRGDPRWPVLLRRIGFADV
jgi:TolB-like protein/Tfp pilus assembly protein PilF